jgi:hypothetical protein
MHPRKLQPQALTSNVQKALGIWEVLVLIPRAVPVENMLNLVMKIGPIVRMQIIGAVWIQLMHPLLQLRLLQLLPLLRLLTSNALQVLGIWGVWVAVPKLALKLDQDRMLVPKLAPKRALKLVQARMVRVRVPKLAQPHMRVPKPALKLAHMVLVQVRMELAPKLDQALMVPVPKQAHKLVQARMELAPKQAQKKDLDVRRFH